MGNERRMELALDGGVSNEGLREYLRWGDLTLADLQGRVLDLGSGYLDRFSREATKVDIDVISIDPLLSDPAIRSSVITGMKPAWNAYTQLPWAQKSVAGFVQELPLQNETINTIVSSGMVQYLDPTDYETTLSEMYRVLAPGGKAHLFPVSEIPDTPYVEEEFFQACRRSQFQGSSKAFGKNDIIDYRVITLEKPLQGVPL